MRAFIRFLSAFLILIIFSAGYAAAEDGLYLRDIPVFPGMEETGARLEILQEQKGSIWALNLSGGSARAFSHIGVLRRLEEEGLRPDVIITNSMGSIVGLSYAAGMSIGDLETLVGDINLASIFELKIPAKGGLIDVDRFEALFSSIFGDLDISECPIPVFVVTEDLKTKRTVVISRGDFSTVLKASFALPFYFDPVDFEGYRLIDGGISNLVPIRHFDGIIENMVVSSAFYDAELNLNNPVTILNVAMDITKGRAAVEDLKYFDNELIRCDVEKISFMAFDEGQAIIEAGYRSCDAAMPAVLEYLAERGIYPDTDLQELPGSAEYRRRLERVKPLLKWYLPPYRRSTSGTQLGGEIFGSYRNPHFYHQKNYLAARQIFKSGAHRFEADLLYDAGSTAGLMLRYSLNAGIFQGSAEVLQNIELEEGPHIKSNNFYSTADAVMYLPFGEFVCNPFIRGELLADFPAFNPKLLAEGGISLSGSADKLDGILSGTGFSISSSLRWKGEGAEFWNLGFGQEVTLFAETMDQLSLGLRAMGRFPFYGPGGVAVLTYNDFFRSSDSASPDSERRQYPYYIIANGTLFWRFGKYLPTIGEILKPDQTGCYLFCDNLFTQEKPLHLSAGAGLKLEASLIGLSPYTVHLLGGWDFDTEKAFFTLNWKSIY